MSRRVTISPCPSCNEVERLFVENTAEGGPQTVNRVGTHIYQAVCWECQARGGLAPSKRQAMKVWNKVADMVVK